MNAAETVSVGSASSSERSEAIKKVNLKDMVPKYDPKVLDISLFFSVFERQAKKANVEEENWVSQLIPLLPPDIIEIIVKEPPELSDQYAHIKLVLLKRFKLTAVALRQKFETHNRKAGELWADLLYELRTYLDNWLESVEADSFEKLKELILLEQLKKRVPTEIKTHYLDTWEKFAKASDLVEKLDYYESLRPSSQRFERKSWNRRSWERKRFEPRRESKPEEKKVATSNNKTEHFDKTEDRKIFDKRREIRCYACNEIGHIRPSCPKIKNGTIINHVGSSEDWKEGFKDFLSVAKVNGIERDILRDSGSVIDVCCRSWVANEDFSGEKIYVKQPLDSEVRCLPLANVILEGNFGVIQTKVAVKCDSTGDKFYLLGNKTAELISEAIKTPHLINAVMTRGQAKRKARESERANPHSGLSAQETGMTGESEGEEGEIDSAEKMSGVGETGVCLPPLEGGERGEITKISPEEFLKTQRECETLGSLWQKAKAGESEFCVENHRLVRKTRSKKNEVREQLVVPLKYRKEILQTCHNYFSGHLGTTKTKDVLLREFYWPNCYQEVEKYVQTCPECQIVGKNCDKKRAPLKLVPIITEVFTKVSVDCVGPLMETSNGNRYLVTVLCVASKYPEAIPVKNIKSESIVDALLQVFSRIGFPKEVQCDLGRSFTSVLTTEFFDKFGIKVSHSSVAHPQSTMVERLHSSLKRVLKVLCLEMGTDWEKNLASALFALRTVTHESTGFSPAELVFGKNLRTPQSLVCDKWRDKGEVDASVVEYVFELANRLKKWQDLAGEQMKEMQIRRKTWYDRNTVSREFKVGEQVLVLATSRAHKMEPSWIGPGTVTGKISETNYVVDIPGRRDNGTIYHVNMIKPYHLRPEFVNFLCSEGEGEEIDSEPPYPSPESTNFNWGEIIEENQLLSRASEEQVAELGKVLKRYQKVFSSDPGCTPLITMDIELTSDKPVRARPYRLSPRQREIMQGEIKRLLELDIVEIGQSDYASPMILVEAPGKPPRPCIDFRRLNAICRTEFFPLPNIEEVVEKVSAAPYITIMDLTKGYFQIPLTDRARRYAAFVTPFGTYLPKKMMFGLVNAPYYFCKLMAQVLGGLENFSLPYIDDIAIFSETWEQHVRDVECVLGRLQKAGLTVKPSKCRFAQSHVKFLGHEVGSGKRSPSEVKIAAVKEFPTPSTKTQVRSFLGLVGYYQKYIPRFSDIASPLTDTLKGKNKREKIKWTEDCERAFQDLKGKLSGTPVLYAPDFSRPFVLQSDASNVGAGLVLSQMHGEEEHPVVFLSKKFTRAERNYSTVERELAAIVYGLKKLKHYLDGQKFVIQTDHNPLVYLKKMMGTNSRLTRWALCLQEFDFTIEYKKGKLNGNADALSRQPFETD